MFRGKTIFITGGASGIGRRTALRFAEQGANVVIVTKSSEQAAKDTVAQIEALGGHGIYVLCDIAVEAQVEQAIAAAVEAFGAIDIAFNNAGVGPDGVTIPLNDLTQVSEHDWDWVSDTCLKGAFFCIKHELRQMRKQTGDRVILSTASTAGLHPMANFGAYGPAKAGLVLLTKEAAVENKEFGIRCNVICPGPTAGTGMSDRMFGSKKDEPQGPAQDAPQGPPMTMNSTDDIANLVLFLCSPAGQRINGNVISVDGGLDIF